MRALPELIGAECDLDDVSTAIKHYVRDTGAPAVGALHITCSDESERECIEAFQRRFAEHLLPGVKIQKASALHTANLGGRYEWGAVGIAEQHFATPTSRSSFKVVVIKINAHVAVEQTEEGGQRYGRLRRYDAESFACGALHAALDGSQLPFAEDLREAFCFEATDRVQILSDTDQVDPKLRPLFAAVVSSRLQARRAILEIQEHNPTTPTLYLVVPCVTLNRPSRDSELLCGLYIADRRTASTPVSYRGLGDDPSKYGVESSGRRLRIVDDQVQIQRSARNHRELIRQHWASRPRSPFDKDERIHRVLSEAKLKKHDNHAYAKVMLKSLIGAMAELNPIASAILLFAEGAVAIHHAHRVHRLVRDTGSDDEATRVLNDIHSQIDSLPHDRAQELLEVLLAEHQE